MIPSDNHDNSNHHGQDPEPNGQAIVWLVALLMAGLLGLAIWGCASAEKPVVQVGADDRSAVEAPVKVDAPVTVPVNVAPEADHLADVEAKIDRLTLQVGALNESIGGDKNEGWVMLGLVCIPIALQLADKYARRWVTWRRVDTALKGICPRCGHAGKMCICDGPPPVNDPSAPGHWQGH